LTLGDKQPIPGRVDQDRTGLKHIADEEARSPPVEWNLPHP